MKCTSCFCHTKIIKYRIIITWTYHLMLFNHFGGQGGFGYTITGIYPGYPAKLYLTHQVEAGVQAFLSYANHISTL